MRGQVPISPSDLFALLDRHGIRYTTVEHAPVFTVEEAQALRGLMSGAHTKNLFLRDNKKAYFLVTVEEERPIDLKRLRSMVGAKGGLSFGSPEALFDCLGVRPGAVTPLAAANDEAGRVSVFLDAALLEAAVVNCHPLVNTQTTALAPRDLVTFLRAVGHEPTILSFTEGEDAQGSAP
jgi:Ala-tRNA(Pro) deacylase